MNWADLADLRTFIGQGVIVLFTHSRFIGEKTKTITYFTDTGRVHETKPLTTPTTKYSNGTILFRFFVILTKTFAYDTLPVPAYILKNSLKKIHSIQLQRKHH